MMVVMGDDGVDDDDDVVVQFRGVFSHTTQSQSEWAVGIELRDIVYVFLFHTRIHSTIHPSISTFVYISFHQRQGNAYFHCKLGNIPALSLLAPSIAFSRLSIIIIIIFLGFLFDIPHFFLHLVNVCLEKAPFAFEERSQLKHRDENGLKTRVQQQ